MQATRSTAPYKWNLRILKKVHLARSPEYVPFNVGICSRQDANIYGKRKGPLSFLYKSLVERYVAGQNAVRYAGQVRYAVS